MSCNFVIRICLFKINLVEMHVALLGNLGVPFSCRIRCLDPFSYPSPTGSFLSTR